MNHPEEAPKLPKFPFIAGDLVLIATAFFIASRSATPITPGPLVAITICVILGAALAVIPFLADYARRQDAELTERQNQIAALARTTADSAEQLGIVASGLNGIAESSKHHLDALGQLPAKLQERIETLAGRLDAAATSIHASVKADVAQLEAAAEKLSRDLAHLDSAAKTKTDKLGALEKELAAALARATGQLDAFVATAATAAARLAEVPPPPPVPPAVPRKTRHASVIEAVAPAIVASAPGETTEPAAAPVPAPEPSVEQPAPVVEPPAPEPVATAEESAFTAAEPSSDDVPVDAPEPPKPPRARKSRQVEDSDMDLGLIVEALSGPETSVTSDGFTRLVATAYIGIGNKLFIRGDGPGLSWEKGVPLQFVSIGKWRWETPDATAPVTIKLYKNDQIECYGLGALTLQPGRQHEVNAGF